MPITVLWTYDLLFSDDHEMYAVLIYHTVAEVNNKSLDTFLVGMTTRNDYLVNECYNRTSNSIETSLHIIIGKIIKYM